jgi:hypothetical protein
MVGTAGATRTASPSLRDREIDAIAAALEAHGPATREALARQVGARRWGPGRFQAALVDALLEARIRRAGRRRYALAENGEADASQQRPAPPPRNRPHPA